MQSSKEFRASYRVLAKVHQGHPRPICQSKSCAQYSLTSEIRLSTGVHGTDVHLSLTDPTPKSRAPNLAFWLRSNVRLPHHHARRPSQRLAEHQSHPDTLLCRRCTRLLARCGCKQRVFMVFQAQCSVQRVDVEMRSSRIFDLAKK